MRRGFLGRLLALPGLGVAAPAAASAPRSKVLIKSAWGIFVGLVQWADKVLTE
jgi:hypothetical protein